MWEKYKVNIIIIILQRSEMADIATEMTSEPLAPVFMSYQGDLSLRSAHILSSSISIHILLTPLAIILVYSLGEFVST